MLSRGVPLVEIRKMRKKEAQFIRFRFFFHSSLLSDCSISNRSIVPWREGMATGVVCSLLQSGHPAGSSNVRPVALRARRPTPAPTFDHQMSLFFSLFQTSTHSHRCDLSLSLFLPSLISIQLHLYFPREWASSSLSIIGGHSALFDSFMHQPFSLSLSLSLYVLLLRLQLC